MLGKLMKKPERLTCYSTRRLLITTQHKPNVNNTAPCYLSQEMRKNTSFWTTWAAHFLLLELEKQATEQATNGFGKVMGLLWCLISGMKVNPTMTATVLWLLCPSGITYLVMIVWLILAYFSHIWSAKVR